MLTVPGEFKLDVYQLAKETLPNYKQATLQGCIEELGKLATRSLKDKKKVAIALEALKANHVEVKESTGFVDDLLVKEGVNGAVIATSDKELRKRLKEAGAKVLVLELQKKRFTLG